MMTQPIPLLLLLVALAHGKTSFERVVFDSSPSAKCLDGTPAGYFISKASARSVNSSAWLILFQGGSSCATNFTCQVRTRTELGSSKEWSTSHISIDSPSESLLALSAKQNPITASWNLVYVPYCSGDHFMGKQTAPNSWGLRFSGYHIVDALRQKLSAELKTAGEIVLVGDGRAGGMAVLQYADLFRSDLKSNHVHAIVQGGWQLHSAASYENYLIHNARTSDAIAIGTALKAEKDLYDAYIQPACEQAHSTTANPELCLDPAIVVPHVKSDLLIAQNIYVRPTIHYLTSDLLISQNIYVWPTIHYLTIACLQFT